MEWNYAELSRLAKTCGGPEALVDTIFSEGIKKGKIDMVPVLLVTPVVGVLVYKIVETVVRKIKMKKAIKKKEIEELKKEIVKGIKEYDKAHQTEESYSTYHN